MYKCAIVVDTGTQTEQTLRKEKLPSTLKRLNHEAKRYLFTSQTRRRPYFCMVNSGDIWLSSFETYLFIASAYGAAMILRMCREATFLLSCSLAHKLSSI